MTTRKVGPSTIVFLAVATLTLLCDGFDLAAIGYVGPELIKHWHVAPTDLVPVYSAGIFGLLAGGPLLGFVGDRFGRKTAVLVALSWFGLLTLATAAATSLTQLLVLRFLTGLGLGGLIPNVIALAAEAAPKRLRGTFAVIVSFGVPLGISCPGFVAAIAVPVFGWQVLMVVGGVLPLLAAALAHFLLPESPKYLAQRAQGATLSLTASSETPLAVANQERASPAGSIKALFGGGLARVTPLLWLCLAANQMANFFSLTWLPTLLQANGASTAQAGVSASLFSIGGLAGGLCVAVTIDRLGVVPLVVLFLAGAPLVAAIGLPSLSGAEHTAVIVGAGFCVTGINFGMNGILGMVYPTPVRAIGAGSAHAAGRIGALAAPIVGGALLGMQLPVRELLFAPAIVLSIGAAACVALAVVCVVRFRGVRVREYAEPGALPS